MQIQTENLKNGMKEINDNPYAGLMQMGKNVGSTASAMSVKYDKYSEGIKSINANTVSVYGRNGNINREEDLTDFKANSGVISKEMFDSSEYISMTMNGLDARDIEDGSLLEEYNESALERAIERVKTQRRENREALENQVEKIKEEKEVSDKVSERIQMAYAMSSRVSGLSSGAAANIIENNMKLSPKTIDGSLGITDYEISKKPEGAFEEVKEQVVSILGLDASEKPDSSQKTESSENVGNGFLSERNKTDIAAAAWLFDYDIPITKENVIKYNQIEELKSIDKETLKERILDRVMEGFLPEEADLSLKSTGELLGEIEDLVNTDDESIRATYPEEESFSMAKWQIEEIRLRMSVNSLKNMDKVGIKIDISNLSQMVENMRETERENMSTMLVDNGLSENMITEEKIGIAIDLFHYKNEISTAPVSLLGQTIGNGNIVNIRDMSVAAVSLKSDLKIGKSAVYESIGMSASRAYDAVGTQVRKDLGDSIKKAFGNIDDILKDINMSATAENKRAVRILAYNSMEINSESVSRMREYDVMVSSLMKNMTPKVVAGLIESDDNPLEMSIEELGRRVSKLRDNRENGDVPLKKLLWKMDKQGDMTKEQRESMIGIYRLLDKVEKSDGALIGQVIKENRELSLASLLGALRTGKAMGMDSLVGDETDILQGAGITNSISEQINSAFTRSNTDQRTQDIAGNMDGRSGISNTNQATPEKPEYAENIVREVKRNLSPAAFTQISDLAGRPLDEILDYLENSDVAQNEEANYYNSLSEDIKKMALNADDNVVRFLNEMSIPDHMVNIYLMKNVLTNGGKANLEHYSKDEAEELIDSLDDADAFEKIADEIDEKHLSESEADKNKTDITYDKLRNIYNMAASISFYRGMRRQNTYSVPIITENGVTPCNITFVAGENAQKGSVDIAIDSEKYGALKASLRVSQRRVQAYVTSDSGDVTEVRGLINSFTIEIEERGFTMERTDIAGGRRSPIGEKPSEERPDNRDLYLLAKIFIQNIAKNA